ncbi:MAG: hypothetical protein JXN60_06195, partial [Lentisphaerae bacterium]|nr:hypothetical protein [Lentisphaerota bacterium]
MNRRKTKYLLIATFAFMLAHLAYALPADWAVRTTILDPVGNLSCIVSWEPTRGLHIKIDSASSEKSVVVAISPDNGELHTEPKDVFPPSVQAGAQFNTDALPKHTLEHTEMVLKLREEIWALYLNNRPIAAFPAPFYPPVNVSQSQAEIPEGETDKVHFQKIADFEFQDSFFVPTNQLEQLADWDMISGSWNLHTAQDNLLTSKKGLEQERSPNFSSLKGVGTNAIIAAG